MAIDTRISFNVRGLGYPSGKIYKMCVWFNDKIDNPGKWVDEHVDEIKNQLKDVCYVHSIEHDFITYTNTRKKEEKYGDIILLNEKDAVTLTEKKDKKEKLVTDIRKIDLPNIDKKDLNTLRDEIEIELFKRDNELSDEVYNFFKANEDLVTVEVAKETTDKHGTEDLYFLRKKQVRKLVEEKILK